MTLFDQISEDIKKAMLARNKAELEALRGIKKELLEAKTSKEANGEVTDELAIKIIQKMAKQGKDTAQVFASQNRQDLADEYLGQVAVYEKYLPKMMSYDEVLDYLREMDAECMLPTAFGAAMKAVRAEIGSKADGKTISQALKNYLEQEKN